MKVFDIIKESSDPADKVNNTMSNFWKKNARLNQRTRANIEARWGGFSKVLTLLMIFGPALAFAANYEGLLYIAEMSDAEFEKFTGTPAREKNQWVSDSRDLITAQFINAYIMGGLLLVVKKLPGLSQLLTLLASLAGITLTKGRGGALVAGAVIFEQAAITAFMVWAASPLGSKWLAENVIVAAIVQKEGAGLVAIWDGLVKKFYEVSGMTPSKPDAVRQATNATSTLPDQTSMTPDELAAARTKWNSTTDLKPINSTPLDAPFRR